MCCPPGRLQQGTSPEVALHARTHPRSGVASALPVRLPWQGLSDAGPSPSGADPGGAAPAGMPETTVALHARAHPRLGVAVPSPSGAYPGGAAP